MAVCRHAFGKYWGDKSTNGEGCDFPLDDVAKAWYARGWKPGTGATRRIVLPLPVPLQKMPRRPKVSAAIRRQADLFFGGLK